jgi:AbrB family looped-hinge helix DNA binding protein
MHDVKDKCMSFYGVATVGAKGQIVIPAEARKAFAIEPGDKLVIVGTGNRRMLGICPADEMSQFITEFTKHLDDIRTQIDQNKEN